MASESRTAGVLAPAWSRDAPLPVTALRGGFTLPVVLWLSALCRDHLLSPSSAASEVVRERTLRGG